MVVFKTGGKMPKQPDDKMDSLKEVLGGIVGVCDKKILGALLVNFSSLYTKEELTKIIAKQTGLDPKLVLRHMEESMKIFWESY